LEGELFGIGDGYSDFQLRESGLINKFFAFTENIARESIVAKADHVTPSFDEFLYVNDLPRAISYPKNRILCLVIGDVDPLTLSILKNDGLSIRHKTSFEEKYVKDVGIIVFTDGEKMDKEQLKNAAKLKTIGYLGNAKSKIDLDLCTKQGIVVFDDPKNNPRNIDFIPKRVADFMNTGATYLSSNFPNLQLPKIDKSHRLIHIHKNVPGIMAKINTVFAKHDINIVSQFLMTNPEIGYAITDINAEYDKQLFKSLKKIEHTIKFRVLY
ncbi:MAG: phosphoserine phosphatase, partial [Pedobacter sp.]